MKQVQRRLVVSLVLGDGLPSRRDIKRVKDAVLCGVEKERLKIGLIGLGLDVEFKSKEEREN